MFKWVKCTGGDEEHDSAGESNTITYVQSGVRWWSSVEMQRER